MHHLQSGVVNPRAGGTAKEVVVHVQRTSRALLVVMLLVGPAWAAPAAAETFTANWTFYTGGKVPAPSPFYDCDFMGSDGLICQ